MSSRVLIFILVGNLFFIHAHAQKIVVHGHFLSHRAKIGEQVPYSLSARYPAHQSIVFPDSTYSFAPFEIQKKIYFPTHTENSISYDSAVYFLTTFEIDSLQSLQLPVFILQERDCTAVYAKPDTLLITQLVKAMPESVSATDLPLKSNADYLPVKWFLNYPFLLAVVGIMMVLLLVTWIVFGKRIKKYLSLRRLRRNHATFQQKFGQNMEKLQKEISAGQAELTLVIWKKYMESLLGRPYTKYTTKEILQLAADDTLGKALHDIDRMIYARDGSPSIDAFDRLRAFAQDQFRRKAEEVTHG